MWQVFRPRILEPLVWYECLVDAYKSCDAFTGLTWDACAILNPVHVDELELDMVGKMVEHPVPHLTFRGEALIFIRIMVHQPVNITSSLINFGELVATYDGVEQGQGLVRVEEPRGRY